MKRISVLNIERRKRNENFRSVLSDVFFFNYRKRRRTQKLFSVFSVLFCAFLRFPVVHHRASNTTPTSTFAPQ